MKIIVWKRILYNVTSVDMMKKLWILVLEIMFPFTIALVLLTTEGETSNGLVPDQYPWMLNLIYLVVVIIFFKFFNEIVGCLPDNDVVQVERYLHMFYKVARKYFRVIVGFLPFLCAFASCFQGKILFK